MNKNNSISLYNLNKQIVLKQKLLSKEEIKNEIKNVSQYIKKSNNKYFMLLCKELSDYTLFDSPNKKQTEFEKDFYECITNRGKVSSISYNKENEVIEIWLKITKDNKEDAVLYYFFCYDAAVLNYNGE